MRLNYHPNDLWQKGRTFPSGLHRICIGKKTKTFQKTVSALMQAHQKTKKELAAHRNSLILISRGSGIRTHDPLLPKQVR